MLRVVVDSRHHLGTAEPLRVLERRVGNELAGLEIEQAQHDGGRAEIHGDPVERTWPAINFLTVEEHAVALSRHGGGEMGRAAGAGQTERLPLDAHAAAAHGVADDARGRRTKVLRRICDNVLRRRSHRVARGFSPALQRRTKVLRHARG